MLMRRYASSTIGRALIAAFATSTSVGMFAGPAAAADMATAAPAAIAAPAPKWGGFFLGAGVSYNHLRGKKSDIYATGLSEVYRGGMLAATGYATGGTGVPLRSDNALAPVAQIGYISQIGDSPWLWGIKASYNYAGGNVDAANVLVPQGGGFQSSDPSTTFGGNLLVRQYKVSLRHQFSLLPIIGYSVGPASIYAGAGPTLAQTRGEMNGVIGFASINGKTQDITGSPVNFEKKHWNVGMAATAGLIWRLDQNWFIDANYTYSQTRRTRDHFMAPFVNPSNGYVYTGVGFGSYASATSNHAGSISINYMF